MSTFDERQKSFEKKFAHDHETQFKILARRNKMLARWAAEKIHVETDDLEGYIEAVVHSGVQGDSHGAVLSKIKNDFEEAGVQIDEREIEREMADLLDASRKEFEESNDN